MFLKKQQERKDKAMELDQEESNKKNEKRDVPSRARTIIWNQSPLKSMNQTLDEKQRGYSVV